MSITIEVCTSIGLAPLALWEVLEPIETHPIWMTDAVSIEFNTASTRGIGTSFVCVTRVGPFRLHDLMTVTRWERGVAMGIEHEGLVTGTGEFRLTGEGPSQTRFCWTEELRFAWWMGGWFGERVGRIVLSRIWRANLERLRVYALSGAHETQERQ